MNARNFDKLMRDEILSAGSGKKLLLHCCCAPCSTACLARLTPHFSVTAFFYNPNLEEEEYAKRKAELLRFLRETGCADVLDCDREAEKFYAAAKGFEREPEGGARCERCFLLRLEKTARAADEGGFDYFATTLTVSPLKNSALINELGESVQSANGAKWLYSDFKKRNGYLESVKLSQKYGLYRQNYCGCVFSRKERERVEKNSNP